MFVRDLSEQIQRGAASDMKKFLVLSTHHRDFLISHYAEQLKVAILRHYFLTGEFIFIRTTSSDPNPRYTLARMALEHAEAQLQRPRHSK